MHLKLTWAQRLKRVLNIQIQTCIACGGAVKVMPKALATLAGQALAGVEDPAVIQKILDHLKDKAETNGAAPLPERRAAPMGLFTR